MIDYNWILSLESRNKKGKVECECDTNTNKYRNE